MKFSAILFGAALCLFSSVEANIITKTPFKSITWNGGETEQVTWTNDNTAPIFDETGPTSVDLMVGGKTNQVLVKNIGKVPASVETVSFNVPKNVGPPGDFYFIKYTDPTGQITSFSGSFSIANVNGKITGFDPKNPDIPQVSADPKTAPTAPTIPTTPTTPTIPSTGANDPAKAAPKAVANTTAANTAAVPAAPVAASGLPSTPSTISSNGANLFPSFAGVATAAVAFAFTYL